MVKDILKDLMVDNEGYDTDWDSIQKGQNPKITLVTCSDSRVSGHIFKKDLVNHVFHIRNIGNQIENNFGSVDYGVEHLHTPILLILGHTDCGAIKASMSDFSGERDEIKKELYPLVFNLKSSVEKNDVSSVEGRILLSQDNVDIQVREAIKRYGTDKVTIVGAIFDIHGHYTEKKGRMIITNINGLTDEEELKDHLMLSAIESGIRDAKVKRL